MEDFLEKTVKIDLYVDVIMKRIGNTGFYIDKDIDIKEIIKKDLINIITDDISMLHIKKAVLDTYDQSISDSEYSDALAVIKRKLFKRSKEIGLTSKSDIKQIK